MKKILIAALALVMAACGTTRYRSVTTLDRASIASREIYAKADSAFLAGDTTQNPFLFDLSGWEITRLDSAVDYDYFGETHPYNTIARTLAPADVPPGPFVPQETLGRKFRWFYTYISYTATYRQLDYQAPVPISDYLDPDEQRLWTQGDWEGYRLMNGSELNDLLGTLQERFMDWYARNRFELSLHAIAQSMNDADKDKLFKQLREQNEEIDPELVCQALDAFYDTDIYTALYEADEALIDARFDADTKVIELMTNTIGHELVATGKMLLTNAPEITPDLLRWKVDGMRILLDDYTLTATYRLPNVWAFVLSGLVLLTAIISLISLCKKSGR